MTNVIFGLEVSSIPKEILDQVEADSYWCFTKLLDNIQDHYTFSQPGIQRMLFTLSELIKRIDPDLSQHFEDEGLQYVQFAFRWMNNLLMREFSLELIIRIWDTEISENFDEYHIYLCAALLIQFSKELKDLQFPDLLFFLQDMPTKDWSEKEVGSLLAQAHVLRSRYAETIKSLR